MLRALAIGSPTLAAVLGMWFQLHRELRDRIGKRLEDLEATVAKRLRTLDLQMRRLERRLRRLESDLGLPYHDEGDADDDLD
jgi:chaperonin cofactor prefoldin